MPSHAGHNTLPPTVNANIGVGNIQSGHSVNLHNVPPTPSAPPPEPASPLTRSPRREPRSLRRRGDNTTPGLVWHVEIERVEKIYAGVDTLSRKYGKHTIFLGSSFQAMKGSQHLTERGDQARRKTQLLKARPS